MSRDRVNGRVEEGKKAAWRREDTETSGEVFQKCFFVGREKFAISNNKWIVDPFSSPSATPQIGMKYMRKVLRFTAYFSKAYKHRADV